jgi:phytoene dehydrogenase-like protein
LAHFGKKVCIFERHNAVGGLNGFYSIAGRKFDVGLHAMTNFVRPGVKGTPLTKLLRQLRIDRDEFALCEQKQSRVAFGPHGEISLRFTNDFAVFEAEVAAKFPAQIDGFRRLVAAVRQLDDTSLDAEPISARTEIKRYISDALLEDMIFCPLMYYGSAVERDMEFGQFAIMFKAVFLEGFARPFEGVRLVLRVLLEKYRAAGGERRMKCGVRQILVREGKAVGVLLDSGEEVTAGEIISSIGADETARLLSGNESPGANSAAPEGTSAHAGHRLSYVETMTVLNCQPANLGWGDDTIVFFNDSERFDYSRPSDAVDTSSGVVCIPNNFHFGEGRYLPEGMLRVTCLANYDRWAHLAEPEYRAAKAKWFTAVQDSGRRFLPAIEDERLSAATVTTDMFTPRTVEKFTGHIAGAIYGSPEKNRQGRTSVPNVYLCGTDQGFLGIVGAMLSGISMANYHILARG